jgi:hypothetical protein
LRLDWAIPCAQAHLGEDGRVTAIEDFGFDTLWVDPFPSGVQFIALIRAAGLPEDFGDDADRTVEAYLLGPGMDSLLSIEFELPSGEPGPDFMEGWEMTTMVPVLIQFTPRAEGTHSLDFYVHARVQPCSIPFQIRAGSPPYS